MKKKKELNLNLDNLYSRNKFNSRSKIKKKKKSKHSGLLINIIYTLLILVEFYLFGIFFYVWVDLRYHYLIGILISIIMVIMVLNDVLTREANNNELRNIKK